MRLFRVNLRGFGGFTTGVNYQSSYVIAENPDEAYQKVRRWLDKKDYGFYKDRELASVELLADDHEYTEIGVRLFP